MIGRGFGEQTAEGRRHLRLDEPEQVDDRQRQLLLLQIGPKALTGDALLSPDIQHIIGDLKSLRIEVAGVGAAIADRKSVAGLQPRFRGPGRRL